MIRANESLYLKDDLSRYEMRKSRFLLPNGIKRNSFDFDLANRESMQMFLPIFKIAFCKFSTYFGFTVGSLSMYKLFTFFILSRLLLK
jgi:hypothetical protein